MDPVPVKLANTYAVTGLLHLRGDRLCLEYQKLEGWHGLSYGPVREVAVRIADLRAVTLAEPMLSDATLTLQGVSMAALADFPGMLQGSVPMTVARADKAAARALVDAAHEFVPPDPV
jgi:hypothetical protein